MDYQRMPFETVQEVLDRIALLAWFIKHNEATDADIVEFVRLKGLV